MVKYYVAASSQHVGKTTSTLGLVKAFKAKGFKVGYCKPVGQEALDWMDHYADKDAVLFATSMGFSLDSALHSPVILGPGATTAYIDHPERYSFEERIKYAAATLEQENDVVIYEGTGHPGVGSVVDLSNAAVAKMLDAEVILIVEGGIGSTIDQISLSMALFKQEGVPIAGLIINKIQSDKIEKVRYYLEKKLKKNWPPILGFLPFDHNLANPIMDTIKQAILGEVLMHPECMDNRVEEIMAASLLEVHELESLQNVLLVTSGKRMPEAIHKMMAFQASHEKLECQLAGIVITGDGTHSSSISMSEEVEDYLLRHRIPVISTHLDTYGSAVKINRIEVKINTRTPWKVNLAEEMIRQYVDLDRLLAVPVEQS